MSCSLQRTKVELQKLGVISSYLEVKSKDMLIRHENANYDAMTRKHGDLTHLGNSFDIINLKGKTKVKFKRPYFEAIDQLENAVFFRKEVLSERVLKEEVQNGVTPEGTPEAIEYSTELVKIYQGSPGLQNIGTESDYAGHVAAVFPESQEKRVLYHGTVSSGAREQGFQQGVTFLTSEESVAGGYVNQKTQLHEQGVMELQDRGEEVSFDDYSPEVLFVIANIQNPYVEHKEKTYQQNHDKIARLLEQGEHDAFMSDVVNDSYGQENQIAVFDNENLHVLSSAKDVAMFSEYMQRKQEATSAESISSEDYADNMADVYSRIDSMIESNEITITCKI